MYIEEIKITDRSYPYLLSQINKPPKKIYVLGNKEILREKSIAIVGGRECSNYGRNIAKEIAYNLAKINIITISGLARRNRHCISYRNNKRKRKNNCSSGTWIRYNLSK